MIRILSLLFAFVFALSSVAPTIYAIPTDNSASPWTIEKAEHLARRALLRVTPAKVQELFDAGSADAAVDLLFAQPSAAELTQFLQEQNAFMQGRSVSSDADMEDLYVFDLYRDPFDAKRKAFTLLEDIFSVGVDTGREITHANIRSWHQKIYQYTLGNFQDLVYESIYDYSPTKYLDLLNANPNNPNQNFAREIMQLFLMEEYLPLDVDMEGDRNYSEEDIAALAFVLTGFTSPDNVTITFNPGAHNNNPVTFLGNTYQSDAVDPAKVVDYIFQERGNNVAQFIVWRLYKFYISETLTQQQLDKFVSIFQSNNYELEPVIRAMLTSNEMYSNESMNQIRYKNPLELAIGTQVLLQQDNLNSIDTLVSQATRTLGFLPYRPPSIFGRPGQDENAQWFNSFLHNQWLQLIPQFVLKSSNAWTVVDHIPTDPIQLSANSNQQAVVNSNQQSVSSSGASADAVEENVTVEDVVVPEEESTQAETPAETSTPDEVTAPTVEETTTQVPSTQEVEVPVTPTLQQKVINIMDFLNNLDSKQQAASSSGASASSDEVMSEDSIKEAPVVEVPDVEAPVEEMSEEVSWMEFLFPSAYAAIEDIAPLELIKHLENRLYLGRQLSTTVRNQFIAYLTTRNGAAIPFTPADTDYQNSKIKGLISLMLMQPEYLLQSGYDQSLSVTNNNSGTGRYANKGSLVLLSFGGGADWLQEVAPVDDPTYQNFRGSLALTNADTTELENGVKMNNAMSSIIPYYQTGELRIVNNVGVPGHSRSHSTARTQMESGLLNGIGALAKGFSQDTSGTANMISMFSGVPTIFQGGTSIAIGSASSRINRPSGLSTVDGDDLISTFRNISTLRQYPGDIGLKTRDALTLDTIAQTAGTPGGGNDTQFEYVKTLISNNIGKVYYMNINGGYDTHGNQRTGMDNNLRRLADRMATFYEEMKALDEEVTLVTFSEFGRTNKVNGNNGTDHGNGGGMIVLSNAGENLRVPSMSGSVDLASEPRNWLTPRIDVRAVWNTLMGDIFGINISQTFPLNPNTNKVFSMVDYTAEAAPNIINFQEDFQDVQNVRVQFEVNDAEGDFDYNSVSDVRVFVGQDENNLTTAVPVTQVGTAFQVQLSIVPGALYFYKIVVNDNNFNTRSIVRSLQSPRPVGAAGTLPDGMNSPFVLNVPQNISANPIQLSVGTTRLFDPADSRVQVTLSPRTQITGIQSNTGQAPVWTGNFSQPTFIGVNATDLYNSNYVKGKLHVGPTDSTISLTLNQEYLVQTPLQNPVYFVDVYHSYDDQNYSIIKTNVLVNDQKSIEFTTDRLGYFMFVDHPNNPPNFIPVADLVNSNEQSASSSSSSSSSSGSNNSSSSSSNNSNASSSDANSSSDNTSSSSRSGSSNVSVSTSSSGGGGGIGIEKTSYELSVLAKKELALFSKDVSLENTQGEFLGNTILKNQQFTFYIPKETQFSVFNGKKYSGVLQKPKRLSAQEKPMVKQLPGKEVFMFRAGSADQDLRASKDVAMNIDISNIKIDWETETLKLYYFDFTSGQYKPVGDGGFISPSKKSLQVNTRYMNLWGLFKIQR